MLLEALDAEELGAQNRAILQRRCAVGLT
jgi:hypothetical protein